MFTTSPSSFHLSTPASTPELQKRNQRLRQFLCSLRTMESSQSSVAPPPSDAVYGIKAVRQMKAATRVVGKPKPSERLVKKADNTYDYFLKEVDPLIGACITHMLCIQPPDVPLAMLDFFKQKKLEEITVGETQVLAPMPSAVHSKAKKEQKVYLATTIGPAVAKLVNRIASSRPQKVLDFIIYELEIMIYGKPEEVDTKFFEQFDLEPHLTADAKYLPPAKPAHQSVATTTELDNELNITDNKPIKSINIAVLGSKNAGKSALVNMLQGKYDPKLKPSLGFRPVTMMMGSEYKVSFYDLGGDEKIRGIWEEYYHDVHGVIYVVDSTFNEDDRKKHVELYHQTVKSPFLKLKPIIMLANKQDLPSAITGNELLQLVGDNNLSVFECSAYVNVDNTKNLEDIVIEVDSRLEKAVEYILGNIQSQYDNLNSRVTIDMGNKSANEKKKRLEKEIRTLKNKIASAFPGLIDPNKAPENNPSAPEDCFSIEEGLQFLASEIGEDSGNLSTVAIEIAALIGYQKLALQIVGAMKAPINPKKKQPMEWNEIKAIVLDCRSQLGLE